VFDTDMGNDIDDAVALAILHALESRGEAKLLAVTITKDNPQAAAFVDLMNTFYGRPEIPVGVVKNGKTPGSTAMIRVPAEKKHAGGMLVYPRRLADAPDATDVLRRILEQENDGSVVFVQVGFSTNLARLLEAAPELVARKARLLSAMAGYFPTGKPEYNVKTDIPSARKVFAEWPTPIVFSGWEVGGAMLFPAASIEKEFAWTEHHPVADSYRAYRKMPYDRPTWDPTSALYAVRPERGYFSLSAPGRVTVDDEGRTVFTPAAEGRHRYLMVDETQRAQTLEAMVALASQPR
jgi:inosine-uridine nucleoside N-ribohydrolase